MTSSLILNPEGTFCGYRNNLVSPFRVSPSVSLLSTGVSAENAETQVASR